MAEYIFNLQEFRLLFGTLLPPERRRVGFWGHVFVFVGVWGSGVLGFWGSGVLGLRVKQMEKGDTNLVEIRRSNRYANLLKSIAKQSKI